MRQIDSAQSRAMALLWLLSWHLAIAKADAQSTGAVNYTYSSIHRMSLSTLLSKYGDREWEIKSIFRQTNGHLGTFRVGDLIGGGYIHFSIGPVGVDGEGYFVQEKPFSRGKPILPILCLMKNGQVVERLPFVKGFC
jgi:hypothetical protein